MITKLEARLEIVGSCSTFSTLKLYYRWVCIIVLGGGVLSLVSYVKSSLLSHEERAWISESRRMARDMSVWRGRDPLKGSILRHCGEKKRGLNDGIRRSKGGKKEGGKGPRMRGGGGGRRVEEEEREEEEGESRREDNNWLLLTLRVQGTSSAGLGFSLTDKLTGSPLIMHL